MSESKESVRVGRDTPTDAELLEAVPPRATGRQARLGLFVIMGLLSFVVVLSSVATLLFLCYSSLLLLLFYSVATLLFCCYPSLLLLLFSSVATFHSVATLLFCCFSSLLLLLFSAVVALLFCCYFFSVATHLFFCDYDVNARAGGRTAGGRASGTRVDRQRGHFL